MGLAKKAQKIETILDRMRKALCKECYCTEYHVCENHQLVEDCGELISPQQIHTFMDEVVKLEEESKNFKTEISRLKHHRQCLADTAYGLLIDHGLSNRGTDSWNRAKKEHGVK